MEISLESLDELRNVAKEIGMEESAETSMFYPIMSDAFDDIEQIFKGLVRVTKEDSRGRARKIITKRAGYDETDKDEVKRVIKVIRNVLVPNGLAERYEDSSRWRVPSEVLEKVEHLV